MMLKALLLMASLTVSTTISAADFYGIDQQEANNIIKKHGKEIADFEYDLQKESKHITFDESNSKSADMLSKKRLDIIDKITKENGYLFVDLQTVFYPKDNTNTLFTTIEIIDQQHPERLRFLNTAPNDIPVEKKKKHHGDLIDAMMKYNTTGLELILQHKISSTLPPCPVYHCIAGFEHPKLKPYLALFNQGVINKKKLIIDTLSLDPNPERRAAAALLIGHFHDPHEIVSILSLHIADKNEGVRNNVMRVLGATMAKAKISEIDVTPFLDALDSPYTTDRNKALYVLLNATKSKASRNLVLQKGSDKLLALIRLQQPNNHDWAYLILKQISGKDFGSTNLTAWKKWVASAKNQSA